MCSLIVAALCLAAHVISLHAHPARLQNQDETRVLMGRLLRMDPETQEYHSLLRQELQSLSKNRDQHFFRIRFDEDAWSPIDMRVTHGSVWGSDSKVEIREGSDSISVPPAVDGNCFLRGKLLNAGGTVLINKCGSMTGQIQTDHFTYKMEEYETSEGQEHSQELKFKVTRKRQEIEEVEEEYDAVTGAFVNQEVAKKMTESHNNGTVRSKRFIERLDIEIVLCLDRNYLDFVIEKLGLNSRSQIERHVVERWETIQAVWGDPVEVGAEVNIQLKHIEFWYINPTGYPGNDVEMEPRLSWFCRNTPEHDHYDMKALYIKGGAGHQMGVAYTGGVCRYKVNCFLLRPMPAHVRFELHEMGHSLGFPHDPAFGDCDETQPEGFMGWAKNYGYRPCYRRRLQARISDGELNCLFEQNVDEPMN